MNFDITFSDRFRKHFNSLSETEKKQFRNKLSVFAESQMHPSMRTKRIQGSPYLWEFSVNMDIRVLWYYENSTTIVLQDIGHHDILKNL